MLLLDFLSKCDAAEAFATEASILIEECDDVIKDGRNIVIATATPMQLKKRKASLQIEALDNKKKKRTQLQRSAMRKEKAAR